MQIVPSAKMGKMIKVFLSVVTSPRRDKLILVNIAKGTGQKGIKFIFFLIGLRNIIFLTNKYCFSPAVWRVDKER